MFEKIKIVILSMLFKTVKSATKVSLNSGDIFILKFDGVLSMDASERIRKQLEEIFPKNVKFVFLDKGLDFRIIEIGNQIKK